MARAHIKDPALEQRLFLQRALICFIGMCALLLLLAGRYMELQIFEHAAYSTRSDENRIQVQPVAPVRGVIFDRNGQPLADNRSVYSLTIVPERVRDRDALMTELAARAEITRLRSRRLKNV